MKRKLNMLCAGLMILLTVSSCGKPAVPNEPDTGDENRMETSISTETETETERKTETETEVETEPVTEVETETETWTGYHQVEDLLQGKDILTIKKASSAELDAIDLTKLPPSYREWYTEFIHALRYDITTWEVCYRVDDCDVIAYISVPNNTEGPLPLMIYNRGGNGDFGANTPMGIAQITYYTNYIVIASQYRETGEGTGKDEFGGADVNDVAFWVDRVQDMGFIDQERVYMMGESRGGMQTCLALRADTKGVIKAAVCVSGVYDVATTYEFRKDMRDMLTRRIGGTPTSHPEAYSARSGVTFADELNTPLLLIHSIDDTKTSYAEAAAMSDQLTQHQKEFELMTREGTAHGMADPSEWETIMEWLNDHT